MVGDWSSLARDERHWVHRCIEVCAGVSREIGYHMQGGGTSERVARSDAVPSVQDLGRQQHAHQSPGRGKLEGSLEEGDGKVRTISTCCPPPSVLARKPATHLRRDLL
jgi:hypothetical protein